MSIDIIILLIALWEALSNSIPAITIPPVNVNGSGMLKSKMLQNKSYTFIWSWYAIRLNSIKWKTIQTKNLESNIEIGSLNFPAQSQNHSPKYCAYYISTHFFLFQSLFFAHNSFIESLSSSMLMPLQSKIRSIDNTLSVVYYIHWCALMDTTSKTRFFFSLYNARCWAANFLFRDYRCKYIRAVKIYFYINFQLSFCSGFVRYNFGPFFSIPFIYNLFHCFYVLSPLLFSCWISS